MNQASDNQSSAVSTRKRGRVLTVLLLLFGAAQGIASVMSLMVSTRIGKALPNAPPGAGADILGLGVLSALMLVGIVAIWKWQRWGAYLMGAVVLVVFGINIATIGGGVPFLGLIGGGTVLFFVSRQWPDFE